MLSKRIVAALLLSSVLAACAAVEVGREFDMSAFEAKVQRGVTTQSDVHAWLGAPAGVGASIESSGERFQQWTYYYGKGRMPRMSDAQFKMLQLKFDQKGVLRAYNWSGERQ